MDIFIIILLIVGAIILFLVELFLIPGISIAGFCAFGCLIYAVFYAFVNIGTPAGFITLAVSIAACTVSLIVFMRSKAIDRVALKKNITSKIDKQAEQSIKVGDTGVTTTRLALIGYAEINHKIVEVKSIGGFLDEKTPVIVVRIMDGTILVDKQNTNN